MPEHAPVDRQREILTAVAHRLAEVAPTGWARLVGNWEATGNPGEAVLNHLTLAVVDGGDRWLFGQVGYDETLYDLVTDLHAAMAGPEGTSWTVLDLELDEDGSYRTDVGYGPAKRSNGVLDEESYGRFQGYLDRWVAEHGPVPVGPTGEAGRR